MCGIAGILGSKFALEEHLQVMVESLQHRGPDGHGIWVDADRQIGLTHTRLSILDLSAAGHQPMSSASDRFIISFNGEIYNHFDIRTQLRQNGSAPKWRGHSDTETLLAGFDTWGIEATVKKTVGMFAFAVWDKHLRTLTLARDRIGEKPLYYGWQNNIFLFSSELKAIKCHPNFCCEIDRNALAAYMQFGNVPGPQSIYKGISKLTPGTLLKVTLDPANSILPIPYWSLLEIARKGQQNPFQGTDAEALTELNSVLSEAVSSQQISDVPLGAFLSGGIDSSLIVALMQAQANKPVHTFTIGFEDPQYNESDNARTIANHLRTNHTELIVAVAQAQEVIPLLPTLYDEPFADSSAIPTFLVSKLARRDVAVSLSGDAGDELFGGYNRYSWASKIINIPPTLRFAAAKILYQLPPWAWDQFYSIIKPVLPRSLQIELFGDKAHKLAGVLGANSPSILYEQLCAPSPEGFKLVLNGEAKTNIHQLWSDMTDVVSDVNRMMLIDAISYLPNDILCKVDRAAMGVSLETRVPFLDHRVVEFAWHLPPHFKMRNGQSKWILRQLLYRHVPRELIERPKKGFGVPIGTWLRGPLREWAENLLCESRLRHEGYLNPKPIREAWAQHLSGRTNCTQRLWNILMFQAWLANEKGT